MSKTETALLERAKDGPSSVIIGYRTGTKKGLYGGREADALVKLVKKGLVVIVNQNSHTDCRNQYSDHWIETVYKLV